MLTALLKPAPGSDETEITGNKALAVIANARPASIDLIKDKIFGASRRAFSNAKPPQRFTGSAFAIVCSKNDRHCRNNNTPPGRQLAAL